MATAARPLVQEPLAALAEYGDLATRTALSKCIRDTTGFIARWATYASQKQTKWAFALLKGRHGWSPFRVVLEYRGKFGSPDYGTLQVLEAFIDVMRAPTAAEVLELHWLDQEAIDFAAGQPVWID